MSRLSFMIKYGSLAHAKQAIEGSDKDRVGHGTAMLKLLSRMKDEGDPDYEKVRDAHMDEFAKDRIKASWVVDSKHVTPKHLKIIATKFPHMIERVAQNSKADADTLRHVYEKSFGPKVDSYDATRAARNVAHHVNAPRDLVEKIAKEHPNFMIQMAAQHRLDHGEPFKS